MPHRHRFGRYEVRPDERSLLVDGQPAALGARAFDLLVALIERRDRLVTKDELLRVVWPGLVVGDNNLHTQISTLRGLLGTQVIATIPGRGYRFAMKLDSEPAGAGPDALSSVALDTANTPAGDGRAAGSAGNAAAGGLTGLIPHASAAVTAEVPGLTEAEPSSPQPPLRSTSTVQSARKLAAILSSDVVGYSRLMGDDDRATLEAIVATRSVMTVHITRHGGRVVDATGDALLGEFPSAIESVRCAVAIQSELAQRNVDALHGRERPLGAAEVDIQVADLEQTHWCTLAPRAVPPSGSSPTFGWPCYGLMPTVSAEGRAHRAARRPSG